MTQTEYFHQVLGAVACMPQERQNKIAAALAEIRTTVLTYGEDGQIALALAGLQGAAEAEKEETANGIQ